MPFGKEHLLKLCILLSTPRILSSSFKLTSVQLSSFELVGLLSSAMISLDVSTSCASFSVEFILSDAPSESTLCLAQKNNTEQNMKKKKIYKTLLIIHIFKTNNRMNIKINKKIEKIKKIVLNNS